MPKESRERSRFLFRVQLTDRLSDQLDEALEIARLNTVLKPVASTLGNPVAFPIIAGLLGVLGAVIYLKLRFPDPLAQARSEVEKVARGLAETIEESKAVEKGFELTQPLIDATRDFLMRLWNDPLFGFGGGRPPISVAP